MSVAYGLNRILFMLGARGLEETENSFRHLWTTAKRVLFSASQKTVAVLTVSKKESKIPSASLSSIPRPSMKTRTYRVKI